jgi:molybdopterin synthase catalytic subunit
MFAGLKELVGGQEIVVELPDGARVGDLAEALGREYPRLKAVIPGLAFAVNEEYRSHEHVLHDNDEIALIPPISGGTNIFELTDEPIDPAPLVAHVSDQANGAVVVFLGTVRSEDRGRKVLSLEYEAYRSMAAKELRRVAEETRERWLEAKVAMRHRIGRLQVGETALIIAVSAPHRNEAFEACRYVIDRIKQIVPIWKKETWEDGESWLEGHPGEAECD